MTLWRRFVLALQFLTVATLWPGLRAQGRDLAGSMAFFPLVGLVLGLALAGARLLLRVFPPVLADALTVALMILLTRGLHMEGLADAADGFWGGRDREGILRIMKDSKSGAFAVMAVPTALILFWAGLMSLDPATKIKGLILMPVLGRLVMVLAAFKSPYARPETGGLAKPFVEELGLSEVLAAGLTALVVAAVLFGARGGVYLLGGAAWVGLVRLYTGRKIGGLTGDCLGAAGVLAELGLLLALAGGI